jgi:thioester reductase-like protein
MSDILVTGATGFVGGYLVDHLLQHSNDEIHCLARSREHEPAGARIFNQLNRILDSAAEFEDVSYRRAFLRARVHVIEGDVRQSGLGINSSVDTTRFREVWHVASLTDFLVSKRARLFETNLEGGRQVLRFVSENAIPLCNYVSTAFVAGTRSGEIDATAYDGRFPPNNPYEESKRAMEDEILQAAARGRFAYRIFRPAVVVGHSRTGKPDPNSRGLYGFLALALSLKREILKTRPQHFIENKLRVVVEDNHNLNLVPVDQVVSQMAEIASVPQSVNRIYHIVARDGFHAQCYLDILREVLDVDVEFTTIKNQFNAVDYMFERQSARYQCYLRNSKSFDLAQTDCFVKSSQDQYRITRDVWRLLLLKFREQWDMAFLGKSRAGAP